MIYDYLILYCLYCMQSTEVVEVIDNLLDRANLAGFGALHVEEPAGQSAM